jgi:hypothetical protein
MLRASPRLGKTGLHGREETEPKPRPSVEPRLNTVGHGLFFCFGRRAAAAAPEHAVGAGHAAMAVPERAAAAVGSGHAVVAVPEPAAAAVGSGHAALAAPEAAAGGNESPAF